MKSLLLKLVPGVVLTMAILMLSAFHVRGQSNGSSSSSQVAVPSPAPQVQAVQVQAVQPIIVCGVCGAQIGQPQQYLVAPAVYPAQAPGLVQGGYPAGLVRDCNGGYYFAGDCDRIQPAPVFSLTDNWRADPRYIRPTRRFAHGR